MPARYSDEEIAEMIQEPKRLPDSCYSQFHSQIQMYNKRGHKEQELDVKGEHGRQYRLILRQSNLNSLDFSIILALVPHDSSQLFRLCRYNGKSHAHTNQIERVTFYDFHIHKATERYQDLGYREDAFAEPTDRYADFYTALICLLKDYNFVMPKYLQRRL